MCPQWPLEGARTPSPNIGLPVMPTGPSAALLLPAAGPQDVSSEYCGTGACCQAAGTTCCGSPPRNRKSDADLPAQWRLQSSHFGRLPQDLTLHQCTFGTFGWYWSTRITAACPHTITTSRQSIQHLPEQVRPEVCPATYTHDHETTNAIGMARQQTLGAASLAHTTNNPRRRQVQLHGIRKGCPAIFLHVVCMLQQPQEETANHSGATVCQQRCCIS